MNLLVCNVIEREIKGEKVQMKPPNEVLYSDALMQIKAVPLLEVGSREGGGG